MADVKTVLGALTAQSLFDLRGVVAVVTGGASGIGLMISSTLMANGAKVYIVDIDQERLDRIPRSYNDGATPQMGRLIGVQGNISKKSEAARLAAHISSLEPSGITALFNNAGILTGKFQRPDTLANPNPTAQDFVKALFDDVPEESFTDTYKVNAVGPYWLTFAFLPLLEKWKTSHAVNADGRSANGGRGFVPQVVMTSSMNGWTKDLATSGFSFPYSFSKSAIGLGTAALAHELLPLGIRVNGIAPGLFPTEMAAPGTSNSLGISSGSRQSAFESPASATGGTRFDMGMLALFLVSNWFVNGETVLIDGGTLLRHPSAF
ncbi:NAD(P)-binding protein [Macrolepiota fuliginosa MF-IS2]|uniref:NAD(P)-binding protein n=1 Tax=Macrolepiota fuliginosa MF-IS2 TaxID=1400762 RepID=A0A9P5X797_9AGAR|nr:NAD(P)-binding protein [Macrolepiota fuliginosa MF-IS2]